MAVGRPGFSKCSLACCGERALVAHGVDSEDDAGAMQNLALKLYCQALMQCVCAPISRQNRADADNYIEFVKIQ